MSASKHAKKILKVLCLIWRIKNVPKLKFTKRKDFKGVNTKEITISEQYLENEGTILMALRYCIEDIYMQYFFSNE